MKLSEKELKDLVENIKWHIIDRCQGTDDTEDEGEYLYSGEIFYYKARVETLEYEPFLEGGEYSHVECGHKDMDLDDVDVKELSWLDNEGDEEIIF